jgi:hypothetical protein
MSTLMRRSYHCPHTGLRVQSYACIRTSDGAYEVVTCTICKGVHLIDPATGRVLGEEEDAKVSEAAMQIARRLRNAQTFPPEFLICWRASDSCALD